MDVTVVTHRIHVKVAGAGEPVSLVFKFLIITPSVADNCGNVGSMTYEVFETCHVIYELLIT